jgi:hypothetical protein
MKFLAFCFLCSDNENPKRDAATAPSAETMAADEPSVQEVEPVAKSSKAQRLPRPLLKSPSLLAVPSVERSRQTPVLPLKFISPRAPPMMYALILVSLLWFLA